MEKNKYKRVDRNMMSNSGAELNYLQTVFKYILYLAE